MTSPRISVVTVTKDRPRQLIETAANSLLKQTCLDFEWIVIADGFSSKTQQRSGTSGFSLCSAQNAIVEFAKSSPFEVAFASIDSQNNFGLCLGRNLGIELSGSDHVAYLDDDNSFKPNFIASTLKFIADNPSVKYLIPQAQRTRGYWQSEEFITTNSFISPKVGSNLTDLLTHSSLFDSNGFVHQKFGCPTWNPQFKIYCDYEYLLSSIQVWGESKFAINHQILVNYIQSEFAE